MEEIVIGNVWFFHHKDSGKYLTQDNVIQLEFLTKGLKYNRIRVPWEYAETHKKTVASHIIINIPEPRIYSLSNEFRVERLSEYLNKVGFIQHRNTYVPFKAPSKNDLTRVPIQFVRKEDPALKNLDDMYNK